VGTESELRRKILASQERVRVWRWIARGQGVLACTGTLLLIANQAGWIYMLTPIVVVGMVVFIACLVFVTRHLFASFMA